MNLRNKLILLFSLTFLVVLGIALLAVYFSMSQYRTEEFSQRLKEKTTTTLRLLVDFREIDHDLLQALDETTINNLYDEKILLFDTDGKPIYSSIDDTAVFFPEEILSRLRNGETDIFYREGIYDVFAHTIQDKNKTYYAIAKAYDRYGKEKLTFLVWTLLGTYLSALMIEVLIAIYLARQITHPIIKLTHDVNNIDINNLARISMPITQDEIAHLAVGFNNMLARVEQSYSYQKNLIHHISHELKTPIAILISNLERAEVEIAGTGTVEKYLSFQKNGLMQMASVISTLLDISKFETNPDHIFTESIRLDELIFESFESIQALNTNAKLELLMDEQIKDAQELACAGNERMLKIAFTNILKNATEYSPDQKVLVIMKKDNSHIHIEIHNNGPTIAESEQPNLFSYFFRGENSRNITGIGLGLVIVSKVIQLHHGKINYSIHGENKNCFTVSLPAILS